MYDRKNLERKLKIEISTYFELNKIDKRITRYFLEKNKEKFLIKLNYNMYENYYYNKNLVINDINIFKNNKK